jgi:hypothetical protein
MTKTSDMSLVPVINSQLSTFFLLAMNSALLMGCSMISSELEMVVKSELEQKFESYTELEPKIQRILALESDMQIIVSELARYSTLGNDPMGANSSEQIVQSGSNRSKSDSVGNTINCGTKLNAVNGHCNMKIGLHIAAFSDEKFVLPGWRYLKKQLPVELTEGKRPLSTQIVKQDITYQSLRVGPFTSVYQAKNVCDQARHLVSCAVVEYRGTRVGS